MEMPDWADGPDRAEPRPDGAADSAQGSAQGFVPSEEQERALPSPGAPADPAVDLGLAGLSLNLDPDGMPVPVTAVRVAALLREAGIKFRAPERLPGLLLSSWMVDLGLHEDQTVRMTYGVDSDEDRAGGRADEHLYGAAEGHHVWVRAHVVLPFEASRLPRLLGLANEWNRSRRWPVASVRQQPAGDGLPASLLFEAEQHLPCREGLPTSALRGWLLMMTSGMLACLKELHVAALQGLDELD